MCEMFRIFAENNGWCYDQVCIRQTFKLAQNFKRRTKKKNLKNEHGKRKNKCIEFV